MWSISAEANGLGCLGDSYPLIPIGAPDLVEVLRTRLGRVEHEPVEHPVFGCGSIAQIERGQSVRIHVNFVQHGLKWLDLRFASITPRQINR